MRNRFLTRFPFPDSYIPFALKSAHFCALSKTASNWNIYVGMRAIYVIVYFKKKARSLAGSVMNRQGGLEVAAVRSELCT